MEHEKREALVRRTTAEILEQLIAEGKYLKHIQPNGEVIYRPA